MKTAAALLFVPFAGCATDPARTPGGGIARGEPAPGVQRVGLANMPVSTGPATRLARVLEVMTATVRQWKVFGKEPTRADFGYTDG